MSDQSEADDTVDDEATEAESTEGADNDGLQHGDFVTIEYTARTVEEDQLVDTTDPEIAAEEGVDDENREIGPRTIQLGEGHLFEPLEEALIGTEVGKSGELTIGAEDAFGEYDPDNVETVSVEKIDEDDRYPGAHVHLDNRHGYISTIIGGRARVDFNHPLAGDDITYDFEVVDVVEDRLEQASSLLELFIDVSPEMWIETDEVEEEVPIEPDDEEETVDEESDEEIEYETEVVERESLYIEATPQLSMNQQWLFSKQQIAQQLIDQIDVDRVVVQEVIEGMSAMGMPGQFGGGDVDIDDIIEDTDIDADSVVEELETAEDTEE